MLSQKLGKETVENLTQYIESKIKEEVQDNRKFSATKQDVADVRESIANTKGNLIKWMFICWIGQMAVTFGFILTIFKQLNQNLES